MNKKTHYKHLTKQEMFSKIKLMYKRSKNICINN